MNGEGENDCFMIIALWLMKFSLLNPDANLPKIIESSKHDADVIFDLLFHCYTDIVWKRVVSVVTLMCDRICASVQIVIFIKHIQPCS